MNYYLNTEDTMTDFLFLLKMHYNKFYIVDNKCAMVFANNKWGLVDRNLNLIIPIIYDTLSNPFPNVFIALHDYAYGAFNEKGEVIIPFKYKTYHMLFSAYQKRVLKEKS